jgi:hypothetical protein
MAFFYKVRDSVSSFLDGKGTLIGFVILYISAGLIIKNKPTASLPAIIISLPIPLINWFLSEKPGVRAMLLAKRQTVCIWVFTISCIIALTFILLPLNQNISRVDEFTAAKLLTKGLVVGIVFRSFFGKVGFRSLFLMPVGGQKLLLLLAYTLGLLFFPFELGISAGLYTFGFGCGFLSQFTARSFHYQKAQALRIGQTILQILEDIQPDIKPKETDAIRYYANHNFRELKSLLAKTPLTTVLVVIKASMERSLGKYDDCLDTIENEFKNPNRKKELEGHLFLQKSLCHGEKGGEENEDTMEEALKQALSQKPNCLLANATYSLRLSEGPLKTLTLPLSVIWKALRRDIYRPSPELMEAIVGKSVPMTWTFLIDVFAYGLIKAGDLRFSRPLLTQCIQEDPAFSSAYLHLGEWYNARKEKEKNDWKKVKNKDEKKSQGHLRKLEEYADAARYCFYVAKYIEGDRSSRIRRRAEEFLNLKSLSINL